MIALPCLLYSMDLEVLYPAVPSLTAGLEPTSSQLLWITDIYGFLLAGLLLTMGTLGDRIGRRRLLLIGAAAFGTLSSAPDTLYRVQFYSNPSGNEGKKFLGLKLVSTDASGNAAFSFTPSSKVAAGQTVTAQAEFLEVTSLGTSEFSAPKKVAS